MRYVSQIIDASGKVIKGLQYDTEYNHGCDLTITDMETDLVQSGPIGAITKCLGFYMDNLRSEGIIITHTKKTAMLHEYINSLESRSNCAPTEHKQADKYVLTSGTFFVPHLSTEPTPIVEVWLTGYSVAICGELGSVVKVRADGVAEGNVHTLYDWLIHLCRLAKTNLLKYETIQLSSSRGGWMSTIRLVQTQEAKRFFTKMYMEVVKEE